jgi:hypothetical protein
MHKSFYDNLHDEKVDGTKKKSLTVGGNGLAGQRD